MKKAGSCRSTDVTKLLQKQRRDSQCNGIGLCRFLSTGKTSVHLSMNPQGRKLGGITKEFFSISCIAIAVENLTRCRRQNNCDASSYQSNNFGVSRKRFKPSTPGSKADSNHFMKVL